MEVKVPQLPESVTDATLVNWHRKVGEPVVRDENLVDLETDKVVLEVPAPADGVLKEIRVNDGATVTSGDVLAVIEAGAAANAESADEATPAESADDASPADAAPAETAKAETAPARTANADGASAGSAVDVEQTGQTGQTGQSEQSEQTGEAPRMGPAARKLVEEHDLDPTKIDARSRDGRLTKGDVLDYLDTHRETTVGTDGESAPAPEPPTDSEPSQERREQRVQMTRLRRRIAERLVESQRTAAMLTTFNEADMSAIKALRGRYQESFQARYGIKLGFMSFFVRAVIEALRVYPVLNASVDGDDIVYHEYFDIGVAVSTERGLLVPVLRDAQLMGMARIETEIRAFGERAKNGEIGMDELIGGTFTISNGGIFGSMMSTPILNPPQSGILGMHAIQDRPVVVDGEIAIRPMMYLALSYDHRIVDGREAVQFLVQVRAQLEDPARLILQI